MNKNVESHFAQTPGIDIQRSQFDMSHCVKFSGNAGDIIPFLCTEVLPGDTFKLTTSKVVRLQTLLKPILDNVYLDTYYFFVPHRLVWEHWQNFCGESDQAWVPSVQYSIPQVKVPAAGFGVNSVADYMGISPEIKSGNNVTPHEINALPFRSYAKICDDWFRSEVVTDPLVIPNGDASVNGNDTTASDLYCAYGGPCFKAAKYHDYFTSANPAPLSNASPVTLPLGNDAPVFAGDVRVLPSDAKIMSFYDLSSNPTKTSAHAHIALPTFDSNSKTADLYGKNAIETMGSDPYQLSPNNLYADLSLATAASINSIRLAFQVQRFYERFALSGRRYTEIIKGMFSVSSPDGRLQRSEYLGGNRIPVAIHEVTNNTAGQNDFLGDLGAMSHTSDIHEDFVKSFTEHGYLIGVCCLRYSHSYSQGVSKMWTRKDMFDFYWPTFANLGEIPVYKREIFVDNNTPLQTDTSVFGYQEAWSEYRYTPNRIAGEMRPDIQNTLASWHLSDDYATSPTLSDSWMREDKTNLDRVLAVSSAVSNQFFADFYINNIVTRPMPMYSVPGLIDHN